MNDNNPYANIVRTQQKKLKMTRGYVYALAILAVSFMVAYLYK